MTRNSAKFFGLLFIAIAASVSWQELGAKTPRVPGIIPDYRQLDLFGDAFGLILAEYVEVPDQEKLITAAVNGMLASLDPHSSVMNAKELKEFKAEVTGRLGGVGLEVTMDDGVLKVIAPLDDTPAARAGILANDIITRLDGEEVNGMTLDEATEKMRGRVNTPVVLTILRSGKEEPIV
jgi:carboxyl-terminal processing protease